MAKRRQKDESDDGTTSATPITAREIVDLLAAKHAEDVFVPECKNGPTHSPVHSLLKLDAWAMPRSWAHYTTIGYEVKVSRRDFEQDQKWVGYLDYCHRFYFVCPAGLIRSSELPKDVGLMWVSVNKTKILTKHHATSREPDNAKLLDLMSYVLMCRTKVRAENVFGEQRHVYEAKHIEEATARKQLGWLVNKNVSAAFYAQEQRNKELAEKQAATEELRSYLKECGVDWPDRDYSHWRARQQINERLAVPDPRLGADIRRLAESLAKYADRVDPQAKPEAAE